MKLGDVKRAYVNCTSSSITFREQFLFLSSYRTQHFIKNRATNDESSDKRGK